MRLETRYINIEKSISIIDRSFHIDFISSISIIYSNTILYCLYLWILWIVGCFSDIRYSLFFCLIEDFSPSDNQGRRFLYFILSWVVGNDSSYVFLNNLRKFEKYVWQSWNESRDVQSMFCIFSMNLNFRCSFIMRIVLYSLSIGWSQCSLDTWNTGKWSVISVVRTPL